MNELIKNYIETIMIAKKYGSNESAFAKAINVNKVTFRNHMSGARMISLDTIVAIGNSFPDVNMNWLLCGRGEMLLHEHNSMEDEVSMVSEYNEKASPLKILRELYEQKNTECINLAMQVGKLEATVEQLRKQSIH